MCHLHLNLQKSKFEKRDKFEEKRDNFGQKSQNNIVPQYYWNLLFQTWYKQWKGRRAVLPASPITVSAVFCRVLRDSPGIPLQHGQLHAGVCNRRNTEELRLLPSLPWEVLPT